MPARRRGPIVLLVLLLAAALVAVVALVLWTVREPEPAPAVTAPAPRTATVTAAPRPGARSVKHAPGRAVPAAEIPPPRAEVPTRMARDPSGDSAAKPLRRPVTIHVVVERSGGGPASSAQILALDPLGEHTTPPGPAVRGTKTADADGRADFEIAGGTTVLRFLATLDGEAAASDGLDVGDGAERTITLVLAEAISATVRVLQRDASPIAGALVRARVHDPRLTWPLAFEVKANTEGDAVLPAVPAGTGPWILEIEALATGFVPATVPVRSERLREGPVVVQLSAAVVLRGRCIDEAGKAVTGAEARVGAVRGLTDEQGRFELAALPPEGGAVVFDARGFAPAWVSGLRGDAGDVNVGDVVLRVGGDVRGVVVDAAGAPVPQADVMLELPEARWSRTVSADAQGRFAFEHVAAADHRLLAKERPAGRAWGSGRKATLEGVRPAAPAASSSPATPSSPVASGADVRVVLTGNLSVHVQFLNESDRSAVVVSSVKLTAKATDDATGDVAWAWSGGNLDSVRFEPGRAGVFDVTIEIPGYDPATAKALEVSPDRETRIDVLFRRRGE